MTVSSVSAISRAAATVPVTKAERTSALKEPHAKLDTAIQAARSDKNLDRDQRATRVKQLETQQATVVAHLERVSGIQKSEAKAETAKPAEANSEHRIHVIA